MKRILIILLALSFCDCGVTPQSVQTGVAVAQTVLDFIDGLLGRVQTSRASCAKLIELKDPSPIKSEVRFQCAEINDAALYVIDRRTAYLANKTKDNENRLWQAGRELEAVLNESGLDK